MQRIVYPLFILLLNVGMNAHAVQSSELQRLESCVKGLSRTHTSYQQYLPYWFFHLDNELHQMAVGIRFLNENSVLLKSLYQSAQLSRWDRYLIANSVMGCKKYRENFESRTNLFLLFFISGIVLVLFFLLRLFLALTPENDEVPSLAHRKKSHRESKYEESRHV